MEKVHEKYEKVVTTVVPLWYHGVCGSGRGITTVSLPRYQQYFIYLCQGSIKSWTVSGYDGCCRDVVNMGCN